MKWLGQIRLLPVVIAVMGVLAVFKGVGLVLAVVTGAPVAPVVAPAQANAPPAPPKPVAPPPPPPQAATPPPPTPAELAERALLESLRARRGELEQREAALVAREQVLSAAEKRLTARIDEMSDLQRKLTDEANARQLRDEAGWRGLVKLYEAMKPRDAAVIFDDLEMPVLVQVASRMREAKASPIFGAMKPEKARELTTALARLRAGQDSPLGAAAVN